MGAATPGSHRTRSLGATSPCPRRTRSTSRDGLGVRRDLTALVGATLLLAILLVLGARPADAATVRAAIVKGTLVVTGATVDVDGLRTSVRVTHADADADKPRSTALAAPMPCRSTRPSTR